MKSTVVITMAGMGQRFRDVGYKVPKYQIEAHGHTLFYWAISSLRNFITPESKFVFVVRKEDNAEQFIRDESDKLGINSIEIIELNHLTDGQATSAMFASSHWLADAPLLIYNIDTFVLPEALHSPDVNSDGWIPCFQAIGDHWSFVKLGETGAAIEVREKVRISPHATIGLYWFKTAKIYQDAYDQYYSNPANCEKGERYVAPLYNQMIKNNQRVTISDVLVNAIYPLGTPDELNLFLEKNEAIYV